MTDPDETDPDRVCPNCGREFPLNGQTVFNGPRLLPKVTEDRGCGCSERGEESE